MKLSNECQESVFIILTDAKVDYSGNNELISNLIIEENIIIAHLERKKDISFYVGK